MLPNSLYLRLMTNILITTTPTVENRPVRKYLGIVSGEALTRRWVLIPSERSLDTEELDSVLADTPEGIAWSGFKADLHKARDWAIRQMAKAAEDLGANAVIGVTISMHVLRALGEDYWILIATGTAVLL
jgi:uncharacterized protein YbjQ (UPF0145 family)